jgi:hypothetical protein
MPKTINLSNLSEKERDEIALETVKRLFKNDYGEPFVMTPGQVQLFRAIYEKQYARTQFECYTQYGKSDTVSMAVLLRATTFGEKWPILGATKDKGQIIMSKVIKHVFENDYTLSKFDPGKDDTLEMIKRYKSKEHLSFNTDGKGLMGEVIVLSADAKKKNKDAGDILIGHGAPNLIADDAALIPDMIWGKAMRMLGGHKDNFLLKITNSFGRNHAYKSAVDSDNRVGCNLPFDYLPPKTPSYHRIVIDYAQGIAEGRMTPEYVEEMRNTLDPVMFGILYECTYPPADMLIDGEWIPLLTPDQIDEAQKRKLESNGLKRLGGDIAEGTNYNAFVIRTDNVARLKAKTTEKDLMKTADKFVEFIREEGVNDYLAFLDGIGVGAGVVARVRQMNLNINGVKVGDSPSKRSESQMQADPQEYFNLRAEIYWATRTWILQGGSLEPSPEWMQLSKIYYRVTSDKKIQIMSKQEMRARGLLGMSESTDVPDALSLTFAPYAVPTFIPQQSMPSEPLYPDLGIG